MNNVCSTKKEIPILFASSSICGSGEVLVEVLMWLAEVLAEVSRTAMFFLSHKGDWQK